MEILFHPPLADASKYPMPEVDMLPRSISSLCFNGRNSSDNSRFLGSSRYFCQGRYALAWALCELGATRGAVVLLPAYHCRSLVEPAIFTEAEILFYPLTDDLSPNLSAVKELISQSSGQVKAFILPHYFGFPQKMEKIVDFCLAEGVSLIEDCAHAFYGVVDGKPLGSYGQYAIASPRKFFAIEDGGILVCNALEGHQNPSLRRPSWVLELKAVLHAALRLAKSQRQEKREILKPIANINAESFDRIRLQCDTVYETGLKWFEPEKRDLSGFFVSHWLMKNSPHTRIVDTRKRNYQKWLEGIDGLPGVNALFDRLPEGVVPYVFPLILDYKPEVMFHLLKMAGVPMWRWEDMAVTTCKISNRYRSSLIQLPCHQSLSDAQLQWIINTVRYVVLSVVNEAKL